MRNKKRYVILPALALAFILMVAGCNQAKDEAESTTNDTTVNDETATDGDVTTDGDSVDNGVDDADNNEGVETENPNADMTDTDESSTEGNTEDATTDESGTEANTSDDENEMSEGVTYRNDTYGFTVNLPESWEGFTLVEDTWESNVTDNEASGPQISIRHPEWTQEVPRQDIPILVFTMDQWADIEAEKYNVSAAPIPPTELNRNSTYVFALPPRYNFAYPEGYEEVEDIIDSNPLETFDVE